MEWKRQDLLGRLKDVLQYVVKYLRTCPYGEELEEDQNDLGEDRQTVIKAQSLNISLYRDLFALIPIFKQIPFEYKEEVRRLIEHDVKPIP